MENSKREIKFRAWDCNLKKLIELSNTWGLKALEESDNWKVMQYTGLKDKNGKEIYEGDIIKAPKATGVVVFSEDANFTVDWQINTYKNHSINLLLCMRSCELTLEVIGNIYENPNLLTP